MRFSTNCLQAALPGAGLAKDTRALTFDSTQPHSQQGVQQTYIEITKTLVPNGAPAGAHCTTCACGLVTKREETIAAAVPRPRPLAGTQYRSLLNAVRRSKIVGSVDHEAEHVSAPETLNASQPVKPLSPQPWKDL